MRVSSSLLPLTKVEKEYLDGTRKFTKTQQRYVRCRLRKKLRLLNEESCNVAAALSERSNAAATLDLRNYNKTSAGSGTLVPFTSSQREESADISNPRVLSDMGLAIPRPTRLPPVLTTGLGDPRSVLGATLSNIILMSLSFCCVLLAASLETLRFSVRFG
jgi:hypothetical protein